MVSESVYLHYLNSLLNGDKKQCQQIVSCLVERNVSIKEIYLDVFQRSMYRIGQMWEKEKCSIASEHVATKITESLIEYVANTYSIESKEGKLALITCIDKEYHELGARMVAGFLEALGWNAIFLGANTPQSEIINFIHEKRPDTIGISSSFYINIMRLMSLVGQIKEKFPEQEIIVGGLSLSGGRSECLKKFRNVHYITCLNGLERYLQRKDNSPDFQTPALS
jgi:MerR family transcriptional regulator, light-induced transcriptional regulator